MYVNGYETPIIVDDFFPVIHGRPAFCRTKENEIWGMLLEKAWAKLHGSYMRTEGGQTAHATQHLLGLPAFTVSHNEISDKDMVWRQLLQYDKRNYVMLASSNSGTNDETVDGVV